MSDQYEGFRWYYRLQMLNACLFGRRTFGGDISDTLRGKSCISVQYPFSCIDMLCVCHQPCIQRRYRIRRGG